MRVSAPVHILVLTSAWIAVGVISAIQLHLSQPAPDGSGGFPATLLAQILAAIPWIPATPVIFWLGTRIPPDRSRWPIVAISHLFAGGFLVVVINVFQTVLLRAAGCPRGCVASAMDQFTSGLLAWGHYAFLVYALLVSIGWYRNRPQYMVEHAQDEQAPVAPQERAYASSLTVSEGRASRLLDVSEIEWIEASGDYVSIHCEGKTFLCSARIGQLEKQLDPVRFARIHRSRIVNLASVRSHSPVSHGDCELMLASGTRLVLTRSRRSDVLDRLGRT